MQDKALIFSRLALAAQQSGAVAMLFRGKVQNDGKELDASVSSASEHVKAMVTAKTVIDEAVQEIILLAVGELLDTNNVLIDAEEKTSTLASFPSTDADVSVIIDPIDGTLEYLNGEDGFSVCIGVIEKGSIELVIVFFPARDIAYGISPDGKSYVYKNFSGSGVKHGTEITLPANPQRVIYKSRRVTQDFEDRFIAAGFDVIELDAYSDGLLKVVNGEAAGYIAGDPQMRDILIGPVIGTAKGGFMCDWQGKEIQWPKQSRISKTFYGNGAFEKEFRELMK